MTRGAPLVLIATSLALPACDREAQTGPPTVRLGDSVCEYCNMIISDERWATATVVEGPRGPEPRLFDDFNCQANHEHEHPEESIVERWSHDHAARTWIRTDQASFLASPELRTPMGSRLAAFETKAAADDAQAELNGEVMTFEAAWQALGANDSASPAPDGR